MATNTFKISELPLIQNIEDEDLFLVSDYENGSCYTRKMTVKQIIDKVTESLPESGSGGS